MKPPPALRIAILCEFPTVNGGERSLLTALTHLRGAVEPVLLAPASGRLASLLRAHALPHFPFDVRDDAQRRKSSDRLLSELKTALVGLRPHLLHANSLSMSRLTGQAAAELNTPCCGHLRDILRLSSAAVHDLNRNQALFAVSRAVREFHVAQGCDPHRVQVQYNGVDLEQFRPSPDGAERAGVLHELQLADDAFLLCTIGQIGIRKGLDSLAAAAPRIARRIPQAHFLLVGERYSSKPEAVAFEQRLLESFAAAGLSSRLRLLGYREDVPRLLRAADLLIHPARQEPLGRVLLEAAASEVAIVATEVGGTSEILTDGVSAKLVPPDDPQALTQAIVDLHADPLLRRRVAVAARSAVGSRFSVQHRADELLARWRAIAG